ncbi:MAG: hypothetical protein Q7R79_04530 [bacterium]|nr:hypothetical protein [bacterium]
MKNNQKGIAPLVLVVILALLAGGGYAVVKTNPKLAQKLGMEKQEEKKEAIITILSPNGGEKLITGQTYPVTWSLLNKDNLVRIVLVPGDIPVTSFANAAANFSSPFSWAIPSNTATGSYKIEARLYSDSGSVPHQIASDVSDSYFTIIASATADEMAGWKTYKNEKYKFEIKYPKSTQINDTDISGGRNISFTTSQGVLMVHVVTQAWYNGVLKSPANCSDTSDSSDDANRTHTSINGIDFLTFDMSREMSGRYSPTSATEYCVVQKGIGYKLISRMSAGPDAPVPDVNKDAVLNSMIASFKFTAPSATATSDWKTYKNEKYGFEIEYPDQWTIRESSVKNSQPENSTSFMTMIMGYVKEPDVNVSVTTEKAKNAIAKIQKIIDAKFSYDSSVSEVARDISKESSRYQVYNFTNPNGVKIYSYSFVGKYSETSHHFFFDTHNATIVFSVTDDYASCAKGCAFSTENEAFLAAPALRHWIDSVRLSTSEQTNNWKTYRNEQLGFEFKYPKDLFSPPQLTTSKGRIISDINDVNDKPNDRESLSSLKLCYLSADKYCSKKEGEILEYGLHINFNNENSGYKTYQGLLPFYSQNVDYSKVTIGGAIVFKRNNGPRNEIALIKLKQHYFISTLSMSAYRDTCLVNRVECGLIEVEDSKTKILYEQILSTFKFTK